MKDTTSPSPSKINKNMFTFIHTIIGLFNTKGKWTIFRAKQETIQTIHKGTI